MGSCNLHALCGIGQFVKTVTPFLASLVLTYSSKCLYLFLTEGYHTDSYTILLRMLQCAAFVAPASTFLVQIVGFGYVLLCGTCLTILGVTLPLLISDIRVQEITFAVLYGSGISIMFQATFTAVSAVFRANIVSSAMILGLCAVVMATTQRLLENAMVMFPRLILLGLLGFLLITCLVPAFADVLQTRRLHMDKKVDVVPVLQLKTSSACQDLESDILKVSLTARKSNSAADPMKHELMWKFSSLLWWAVGVHLCCLIASSREFSTNTSMLSLVSVLSLAAFVVKMLLTERMAAYYSDLSSNTDGGYFILGLLGIGSLILKCNPLFIDVHCYGLLFVVSFFHQLKPVVAQKVPENYSFTWIINQCCVDLICTLCTMTIGYVLSHIIYYKTDPPGFSHIFSDVSLSVLASVMVLVSVRYRIKGENTSPTTTAKSNCVCQV